MRKLSISTACFLLIACSEISNAIVLPTGFHQVLVAPGLTMPTTMAFAPDGRIFVAEQTGKLKVVKHDTLLANPFINLNVNIDGERGLLGVAIDPDFVNNQYIYLCYTVPSGAFNRVSRFTASGDTVIPGSELLIIQLDSLTTNYHTGGHLEFGPDGKLYIATGENGRSTLSQNKDTYLGKILRVNSDGTVAPGNPFPGPNKRKNVWVYGLRNPFTFVFQPGTGRMFVDDVGEVTWEEINDATNGGGNYGWPNAEGMSTDTSYENPFYTYLHGTGLDMGCAITGGTFMNPDSTNYPSSYLDHYFYIDYCGNWINMVSLTNPPVWTNFASNTPHYAVCIKTGTDGNLYFLSRDNEAMYKIVYIQDSVPQILNDPQDVIVSVGLPASFTVSASGNQPLSYQWRKGNNPISGANSATYTIPTTAFSDSGYYNCVVTNSLGSATSNDAHLTVTGDQPPTALIDTPTTGDFYTAGQTINFHGSASDPESGMLPDSLFEWVVEFHHNTHVHPGPAVPSGVSSGSFVVPNAGETSANVYYRIYLIVHDPEGIIDTDYVDVLPRTSTITIYTQPQGLEIRLDGQPFTSPYSFLSVEGFNRTISAPLSQMLSQTQMYFTNWSNGGQQTQVMMTPVNDSAIIARYDSLQLQYNLGPDTVVCTTDTFLLHAGPQYSSFMWSDGTVGESQLIHSAIVDTFIYGVTVSDVNGLTGNDSIQVIFEVCNAVGELYNESIKIFPVPSSGEIEINGIDENYSLMVYDMEGRIVSRRNESKSSSVKIDLEPGFYSLLILGNDRRVLTRRKIVVEK